MTLTETPGAGSNFTGWGGACSGTGTTCQVTMDQARNVTATFVPFAPDPTIVKKVQRDPSAAIDEAVKNKLQGEWKFYAKVPRHANEPPKKDEPFHVSPEKSIFVNDSMLRILLFSSYPSRDYQFVRTMMVREVEAKRAKLSIYLQSSKGLDEVQQFIPDRTTLIEYFIAQQELIAFIISRRTAGLS